MQISQPVKTPFDGTLFELGVVLRNAEGQSFMERYDPAGNMANRDAMARAAFLEIQAGRGIDGCVYIDCTGISRTLLQNRGGQLSALFMKKGVDLGKDWLKGAPCAHYTLGGIRIDEHGRTAVPGLYAAGEICGGVHGVNRLAAAALVEAAVFGTRAGLAAATDDLPGPLPPVELKKNQYPAENNEAAIANDLRELRTLLWEHASLVRHADGLRAALARVMQLRDKRPAAASIQERALRRNLLIGEAVIRSALARSESRGAHYRSDCPRSDPEQATPVNCRLRGDELVLFRGAASGTS